MKLRSRSSTAKKTVILVFILVISLIFLWPFLSHLILVIGNPPCFECGLSIEIRNVKVEPARPCLNLSNSTLLTNPVLTVINNCSKSFSFKLNESEYHINLEVYDLLGLLKNQTLAWPMNWEFNEALKIHVFNQSWRLRCVYFSSPKYTETCYAKQMVPNSTMCFLNYRCNNLVLPSKMGIDIHYVAGKWMFRGDEINMSGELLWKR